MSKPERSLSAEEQYRMNEELENYFANTIIPQLFVDSKMILRKFTPPAMTQFSFTEADIDSDFHKVKDNIQYPTIIENIEEVIETSEILEKEIQTDDGKWYQMNILPYVVRKENRTDGVIITFVDITARIYNLRELERLNARHDTLMYALAHDIRQPLTNILLLKEGLKEAYNQQNKNLFIKWTNAITTTTKAISNLVNDFVKENEITPDLKAEKERVNIQSIVQDVLNSFKSDIHTHNVNITTDFRTSEIKFSRTNLKSIVYNLLSNAIKYREPERPLRIDISTKKLEGNVLLRVRDSGRGIHEEHLDKIFKKAERLESDVEGTGMGLYIIKRMVENNNGKLEVASKPGKGSAFCIYFQAD